MWTPGQVREAGPQLLDLAGLGLLGARPGPHPVASRCPDQNGGVGWTSCLDWGGLCPCSSTLSPGSLIPAILSAGNGLYPESLLVDPGFGSNLIS